MKRDGKKLKKQDTKAKKRKVQCENEETKQQRQETVIEVDARGMQLQLQLLTCMKCKEVNFLTSAAHKLSRIWVFFDRTEVKVFQGGKHAKPCGKQNSQSSKFLVYLVYGFLP